MIYTTLKPLIRKRLYEEIIKQLQGLMEKGLLRPGDRLPPERELALQLNVSRTSIREALRSLESMGFIESKVGGGTFIKKITLENIIDPFSGILAQDKKLMMELIEVRLLLESEIARLAAKKINKEKIKVIKKSLELMKSEIIDGGIGINGDNAFHEALAEAAENSAMVMIIEMCGDLLSSTKEVTLRIPGQPEKALVDHKQIFEAVGAGDEEKASQLMKEHLIKAYKNIENENQG